MDAPKPWYFSRTIWASLVVVASLGAGMIGIPLEDGESAALTDSILQAVAAVAGVAAVIGRIAARTRIG